MVNFRAMERQKTVGSPRGEVGEIDTRAPFRSVKAAVSLFGEVAVSSKDKPVKRPRHSSSENVIDRETQLLLAQKELNRTKQQLESAETTKARALNDLKRAKRTLQDLTIKLKTVTESRQSVVEATETVKNQVKQLQVAKSQKDLGNGQKSEVEDAREQYLFTVTELDAAKQELNKIRQDFDATLENKQAAFLQAAEAHRLSKTSSERVDELQKEISAMKETIKQVKVATQQALEEQSKFVAEKESILQCYITAQEEAAKKLDSLKKEYDPHLITSLEMKLTETTAEVEVLQSEMKKAHAADMDSIRIITTELNEATRTLQQVADEESQLRNLVNSLRLEVEDVKKEHTELKEKEEHKQSEERRMMLGKFLSETETAVREGQICKKDAADLKQEAEALRTTMEETEKKLQLASAEIEEAKAAERKVIEELNNLSKNAPDSGSKIEVSGEEFKSLKKKAEESGNMAEKKLADAASQVEEISASKSEAERKLEANLKAIEEIKEATQIALKSAEKAAAAQTVVEGELRKWRQQEQMAAA